MMELMLSAMSSGSGKTMVTCGLLELLKQLGQDPCAFKCGPDYIDPMFHREVLGIPGHNLDLFLCGNREERIREFYNRYKAGRGAVVTEGVMGFYDGLGGSTVTASAYEVSEVLKLPVLLVVSPAGNSITLAAMIRGMKEFRPGNGIRAVLLNKCTPSMAAMLKPVIEQGTGLPVVGYLPPMPEAAVESRHLGLVTAGEVTDLHDRISRIAETMKQTLDLEKMKELFPMRSAAPSGEPAGEAAAVKPAASGKKEGVRIAVARDEAFNFIYAESLDELERNGAQLQFFSPVRDEKLPEGCSGLLLSGGYPELYTKELSENESMKKSIVSAIEGGLPCIAECGGFMYLQKEMTGADGVSRPMAGVLKGKAVKQARLVRFGYTCLTTEKDSMLFRNGESVPVHEFHYYDTDDNGEDLTSKKPLSKRSWMCAHTGDTLYAGFPHLYLAGSPQLAARFTEAARRYQEKKEK